MSAVTAQRLRDHLKRLPGEEFLGTREALAQTLGVPEEQLDSAVRWARDNCLVTGWTILFNWGGSCRLIDSFTPDVLRSVLDANTAQSSALYNMVVRRSKQVQLMVGQVAARGTPRHRAATRAVQFMQAAEMQLMSAVTV